EDRERAAGAGDSRDGAVLGQIKVRLQADRGATMTIKRMRVGTDRGMTLIFVGLSMLAFMSATMLALDVGNLMVARTQAQASADSGALAGATALIFDDFNDRTATGPAKRNAIAASTA